MLRRDKERPREDERQHEDARQLDGGRQHNEGQQQEGGAQSPGEDGVEVPGEGLRAPVPALVEDDIEVHHLSLGPQPPPPEIRVHHHCEGNPDQEPSTANQDDILDAHLG